MSKTKSPFLIVEEFISPMMCDRLLDCVEFLTPDLDVNLKETRTSKFSEPADELIYLHLQQLKQQVSTYYSAQIKGTEPVEYVWLPAGAQTEVLCENSEYIRKKWLMTRNRSFTGVIMLSSHTDSRNLEYDEVYGGKYEFPQWGFGFQPIKGSLFVYPSGPHFLNAVSRVEAGDLFYAKFHFVTQQPWMFNPSDFPGNYQTWF